MPANTASKGALTMPPEEKPSAIALFLMRNPKAASCL